MTSLINISKDDTNPILINPSDITSVKFNEERGEAAVNIYSSKGQLLWLQLKEWNLDAADILQKLRNAGAPLVHFPQRWPAANNTFKEYDRYINPSAVTYATVTEVGEDGRMGTIVGVKGTGGDESSYSNTREEWAQMLAAVNAVKPLLEYKPEKAHARWNNPGGLYIDPASVTRIDGGFAGQVDVHFAQSGRLDVEVNEIDSNEVDVSDLEADPKKRLAEIFNEQRRRADEINKGLYAEFSNTLAAAVGGLVAIPFADVATHVRPEHIGFIRVTKNSDSHARLIIEPSKRADNPYDDGVRVPFATRENALKAMAALTGAKSRKPAVSLRTKGPNQ